MKLMPTETIVSTSDNNTVTLTNFRIRSIEGGDGTSVLLENIQSISVRYKNYPIFMYLGILSVIVAIVGLKEQGELLFIGLIIGGLLIAAYLVSRSHYLTISSGGKSIYLTVKGQKTQKVVDFIDLIEETICTRKKQIFNGPNP